MSKHTHQGKPEFLNKLAPKLFPILASKAKAKKAIAAGELLVNGKSVNFDAKVFSGDEITFSGLHQSEPTTPTRVFDLDLEVLYEDQHLAAVFKPGGIPVNGVQLKTLENALPKNLQRSREADALDQPMPLHRLDAPTTGIVLIAKTNRAQVAMGQQFQQKEITKRYKAVIVGQLPRPKGEVQVPVDGKPATTRYTVVRVSPSVQYGQLTLVDLYPVTGRTHQLRIHMAHLGCPIVGDRQYSGQVHVLQGKGLMLCSDQVAFSHPITQAPIHIETKIPRKFRKYMEREAR